MGIVVPNPAHCLTAHMWQVKLPVGQMDLNRFFLFIHVSRLKNLKILEVGQVMILRKGKPCGSQNFGLQLWWHKGIQYGLLSNFALVYLHSIKK